MKAARILVIGAIACVAILAARWALREIPSSGEGGASRPAAEASPEAAPPPGNGFARRPAPLGPGDPVPEATLVDQNGEDLRLADLRGQVVVMTFLYTHCNMPSMCPLTTAKLAQVQELTQTAGLEGVQFVVVSFDPARDGPERLREYAARYGMNRPDILFATGDPEEIARLSSALKTFYRPGDGESFDHNIVVSLIDQEGILRDEFYGSTWDPSEIIRVLRDLAAS